MSENGRFALKVSSLLYAGAFLLITVLIVLVWFSGVTVRGAESNVVHTIQLILAANDNLFQNPNVIPYNITQYSPIYYIICDGLISLFGFHDIDTFKIRTTARIISSVFLALTVVMMYKFLLKNFLLKKSESLILSSLFVIVSFPWYSLSRPDVLVPFFVMAAVSIMASYIKEKKTLQLFYIGMLLASAVLSKQNAGIFVITFGLFLLLRKELKGILFYSAGFFTGLLFYFLLMVLFHYNIGFIKQNIIDGINNGYNFWNAVNKVFQYFFLYFFLFVSTIIFLVIYRWNKASGNSAESKYGLYFFLLMNTVISLIFSTITALKEGSSVNYYNEFLLLVLLITGYLVSVYQNHLRLALLIIAMIFGINLVANHLFFYGFQLKENFVVNSKTPSSATRQAINFLSENLGTGYFYSTSSRIKHSVPRQCILFSEDIHKLTYKRHVYDYSSIKKNIESGTLRYLLVTDSINSLYGVNLRGQFEYYKSFGDILVFRNKNSTPYN